MYKTRGNLNFHSCHWLISVFSHLFFLINLVLGLSTSLTLPKSQLVLFYLFLLRIFHFFFQNNMEMRKFFLFSCSDLWGLQTATAPPGAVPAREPIRDCAVGRRGLISGGGPWDVTRKPRGVTRKGILLAPGFALCFLASMPWAAPFCSARLPGHFNLPAVHALQPWSKINISSSRVLVSNTVFQGQKSDHDRGR